MIVTRGLGRGAFAGAIVAVGLGFTATIPVEIGEWLHGQHYRIIETDAAARNTVAQLGGRDVMTMLSAITTLNTDAVFVNKDAFSRVTAISVNRLLISTARH